VKRVLAAFLLLPIFFSGSPAEAAKIFGLGSKKYDVVLVGTPVSVRELQDYEGVDAIESTSEEKTPRHVVSFKIERVLIGELAKETVGGLSKMDQAKKALDDKDFIKLGTLNFKDPHQEVEKEMFRVALHHAGETFGAAPGDPLPAHRLKLYLKRHPNQPKTFLLIKQKLLD
jgi:hypothetical protein